MKKKLVASLAAAMVLGVAGTSFAAANPFVDVPAKHWAYASVMTLSQAGIVDGYSDGKFQGDKMISRYEMAQIVARAMARADKADAKQKAEIAKLAAEFAEELNGLGVRVTALEKNQANLKFTGSTEFRYTSQDFDGTAATAVGGAYRLRLDGTAKVDADTTAGIRLTTATTKAGSKNYKSLSGTFNGFGATQASDDNKNNFNFDRLFVTRNIGAVKTTLGAQALKIGTTSFVVDAGAYSFDGVKVEGKIGAVALTGNWGRQQKNAAVGVLPATTIDIASVEASSKIGKLSYGLGYATFKDQGTVDHTLAKYGIGNASYAFDSKFVVGGEYVQNGSESDRAAWNVNATYGYQAPAAMGQQNLTVKYYDVDAGSISRFSVFDLQKAAAATVTDPFTDVKDQKGLNVTYNYAFSKNLASYLQYIKVTDKDATAVANDMGYKIVRFGVTSKF